MKPQSNFNILDRTKEIETKSQQYQQEQAREARLEKIRNSPPKQTYTQYKYARDRALGIKAIEDKQREKQMLKDIGKNEDVKTKIARVAGSTINKAYKNLKQGKKSKKEFKKFLKKKVQSRQVIKDSRGIVRMRKPEDEQNAPFKQNNIYFKNQFEQERRNLFMS